MKHIIFDIGNVLLSFQPEHFLKQYYDEETMGDLLTIIFCSDEWLELDLGTLSIQEAIDIFAKRNPQYQKEITFVLNHWTKMMTPIQENVDIAYQLKEKGYSLYLLSNFHKEAIKEMYHKYPFFQIFDGGVISAYEHIMKPDPEFYQILLERYHLKPEDCLFIDDMLANVNTAHRLGIDGIHLNYDKDLKEELKKKNIVI